MKKLTLSILVLTLFVNAWSQFVGPINAAMTNTKQAWIYPTFEKDPNSCSNLKNYVEKMFNRFKSEGSIILADTAALNKDLSDYGLMVYGTIKSNLFLAKYTSSFPFKLDDNSLIFGGNTYKDENTKLITCLPNPQNKEKGMVIYTAFTNDKIIGINNIFHGPEDYVISITRSGNYDKSEKDWQYSKK